MSEQLGFDEDDRSVTLRRAWDLALHLLATKISKVSFEGYIRPTQPLTYEGSVITLGVANPFAREWLEKKHANAIRSALEFHLDTTGLQVQFVVLSKDQQRALEGSGKKTESGAASRPADPAQPTLPLDDDPDETATLVSPQETGSLFASLSGTPAAPKAAVVGSRPSADTRPTRRKVESPRADAEPPPIPSMALNERYLFEYFLVGRSNRLAHAGALNVAHRPGEVYNPLFLYGGPGLGKTHLLQGIAHALQRTRSDLRVAYVSGEYFAQHYITAVREHQTEDFRRQYREVDVWLVDDVQFIAGKEHTKEEFFHTFNALYQTGKQIVIASDRSPRELNTMDERLRSRFQSGLIADINPPELETRIAILQQFRKRENVDVSDDVLEYIASAIQSNIRALEGALTKLIAYSSIMNAPVSAEIAQSVLGEYFIEKPIRSRRISVEEIVAAVAERFGTTSTAIKGPARNKDVSLARHVAMYLCRELLPGENIRIVGAAFGGRDHTTIVKACQKLRMLMDIDSELESMVEDLTRALSA